MVVTYGVSLRSVCVRRSAGLPGSTRILSSSSSVCWRADVAGESTWTLLPWQVRHYPEAGARCVACSHKIDAVTLLGRTLMSLWIANNMGQCVESFCNKRWDQLTNAISTFGSVTLGAALLNALLKYFVAVTALDVRLVDVLPDQGVSLLNSSLRCSPAYPLGLRQVRHDSSTAEALQELGVSDLNSINDLDPLRHQRSPRRRRTRLRASELRESRSTSSRADLKRTRKSF